MTITFCDVGENGVGMEKLGTPTSHLVTVADLRAMKWQFENGHVAGKPAPGVAELYDLKAALEGDSGGSADAEELPVVREASVLVLRGFTDHVLGAGTLARVESELESMQREKLVDSEALMRGSVKNKHARHNNVIADFSQAPDIAKGKGTVVPFSKYEALRKVRNMAAVWMQQDHPLVAEQNRYFDTSTCGIGWHGDAERAVVWGLRVGEAAKRIPLMFRAWHRGSPVGPKTTIWLQPGDVYVMSSVAVGTDWKCSSRVTWRHAAGAASCKYSKDPAPRKETPAEKEAARLDKAIAKGKKVVRKSPFLR